MKQHNILFITTTYNTFQKSQIDSLAKYFEKIFVFVRYKPIAELYNIIPIRSLRRHTKKFSINLSNKPRNVEIITLPIFYLPITSSYLRLGDRLFKKIDKLIKRKQIHFDLIHAHHFWTSGYVAYKLKDKYRTPYIVTNHDFNQVTNYLERGQKWFEKIQNIIINADHLFVVNQFMKDNITKFIKTNNINILPAGFNESIFFPINKQEARKQLSLPLDNPIVVNISSLDDNKNIELFINGFSKMLLKFPYLKGYIIGDGRNYSSLFNRITELGLEHSLQLIGALPHQNINVWINASDIITLCSYNEGSPTVMYETLACGRPFLGSAVGGIPEVIISTDYGFTFDPNNLDDYVEKMQLMLESHWDESKIIEYGNQFSQETLGKTILRVYRSLIIPTK